MFNSIFGSIYGFEPMFGSGKGRCGSVQFQLFGPEQTDWLNSVRAISLVHNGTRWEFGTTGTQQEFEEPEHYTARRRPERFTPEILERYCRALGVDVFNADAYGPEATLLDCNVPLPANPVVRTLAEARKSLGIEPL